MKRTALLPLAVVATVSLAACGSSAGDAGPTGPAVTADVGTASAVTPLPDDVIEAARGEGELLLYTNAENQQMAPIKKAFEAAYPGIKLRSLVLGDEEMFQRYKTEAATGTESADVIMSNDTLGWLSFIEDGNVEEYEDPNAPNLPDYATLAPGVYAASEDPVIAVFNKALLPENEQPETLEELAAMAPELEGGIGTTDIGNAIQFASTNAYITRHGEAGWKTLKTIGAHSGVESSNGPLVTKLAQGRYAATFFVTGAVRAFITDDVAKVVNYTYLEGGTPVLPRAFAVTAEAAHPNAAKVFVNWLLSVKGQEAACEAGFTPYRDGVECPFGLQQVAAAIGGEKNLIIGTLDPEITEQSDELIRRWNEAFGR